MRSSAEIWEPFKSEQEFLDFSRSYLSEAFPNPERIGCPPDDALRSMALRPLESDLPVSDHLTCCSPCFAAYMSHLARVRNEMLASQRIHRDLWIRRLATAFGIAAILVLGLYLLLTRRRSEPLMAPRAPEPIIAPGNSGRTPPATFVQALIDLSKASPTRGTDQSGTAPVVQTIQSGLPVDLTVRLPFGSEERLYSITLRSGQKLVWSQSVQAHRQNGDTLLRTRADLSTVPAGKYDLQVSSSSQRLTVPVLIEKSSQQNTGPKP